MTSHPEWNEKTSGLEVARVLSQAIKGRNFVITGVAPNGIGEATALAIASQTPATLIIASRTQKRMGAVAEKIRSAYPDVNLKLVTLDLASQDSVRSAAAEITALVPKIDVLINNAAIFIMSEREWTKEKIEIQLGVNHIGHFLLAMELMPLLEAAAKESPPGTTRIINVSSEGHRMSPLRFHDYNFEDKEIPSEEKPVWPLPPAFSRKLPDGYEPCPAYGQSKTANILFSVALQERLRTRGIASYALHPGTIDTELGRDADTIHLDAISKVSSYVKTLDEGASTSLVASLDPALSDKSGVYLLDCQFGQAASYATDPDAADRLWKLSEELVKSQQARI